MSEFPDMLIFLGADAIFYNWLLDLALIFPPNYGIPQMGPSAAKWRVIAENQNIQKHIKTIYNNILKWYDVCISLL